MGFISLFKVHQLCLFCQKAKCSLGLSYNLPTCFSKTALQFLLQMSSVYKECHRNRMPKKKKKKETECHFLQDITLSGETYAKYHLPLLSHRTYYVLTTSNTSHSVDSSVHVPSAILRYMP